MENRGNTKWQADTQDYSEEQIESVLNAIGLDVEAQTFNDFLLFCPFHGNRDTPSFSVSKEGGFYICFNPSCMVKGTLIDLVQQIGKRNYYQAMRIILKAGEAVAPKTFEERYAKATETKVEYVEIPQADVTRLHETFLNTKRALDYMQMERGFDLNTLRRFEVGYSKKRDMIAVPAHSPDGKPIGVIGRGITEKEFKNSAGMHTSKFLFNLHRARRESETAIICESSFDAMRIDQAGYPNVVASLGGNFSIIHADLITKNFNRILIMTDFDDKEKHKKRYCMECMKRNNLAECRGHNPGRDLARKIISSCPGKSVSWASYDYMEIYPHGAKDAGDMTDEEIAQCIKNAVTTFEYQAWNIY